MENWTQVLLTVFEVAQGDGVIIGGLAALWEGGKENLCPVSGGEEQWIRVSSLSGSCL